MTFKILVVGLAIFTSRTALAQPNDPVQVSIPASQMADTVHAFAVVGLRQSPDNKTMFVCPASFTDHDLERIPNAPFPFGLHISGRGVTNDGVRTVSRLRNLSLLNLISTSVTCESDCGFEQMHKLKELSVSGSPVTNAGLQQISKLNSLTTLDVRMTAVHGPGLEKLSALKHLTSLEPDLTTESLHHLRIAEQLHALPCASGPMPAENRFVANPHWKPAWQKRKNRSGCCETNPATN